jgi:hypothetical protein
MYLCTQIDDLSLSWLGTSNTQIHDHSLSWLGNPNTQIHDLSLSWLGTDRKGRGHVFVC